MKRFLTVAAAMLALTGMGQVAMRKLEDLTNTNLVCVTDYGPQVVSLTQRVTGLEGNTNAWSKTVSNLAALSNNVASLSSRVAATNALFSAWFSGLQNRTSYWDAAHAWGNWAPAVASNAAAIAVLETNTVTRAGTNGWEVGSHDGLATTGGLMAAVGGLVGTQALDAAIAPLRVPVRWYDAADSNRWAEYTGGGIVREYAVTPIGWNLQVPIALTNNGVEVLAPTNIALPGVAYPLTPGSSYGSVFAYNDESYNLWYLRFGVWDYANEPRWRLHIHSGENPPALGEFEYVIEPYGPNETGNVYLRCVTTNLLQQTYVLPTNAIPPELADLDALTAWLNSMFYTKAQTDAALSNRLPLASFTAYTNALPSAGNTQLNLTEGTNLTVTGATYAYRATVTNAYRLAVSPTAPAFHYGLTIIGTNACTLADNLLLRGTKTHAGTNCVAFQPWTNGTWEVLWGAK